MNKRVSATAKKTAKKSGKAKRRKKLQGRLKVNPGFKVKVSPDAWDADFKV